MKQEMSNIQILSNEFIALIGPFKPHIVHHLVPHILVLNHPAPFVRQILQIGIDRWCVLKLRHIQIGKFNVCGGSSFLEFQNMLDDFRDAAMIFHHLLVVTSALSRRPCSYTFAHQDVYLRKFSELSMSLKKLAVSTQKIHIGHILVQCPERFVVNYFILNCIFIDFCLKRFRFENPQLGSITILYVRMSDLRKDVLTFSEGSGL